MSYKTYICTHAQILLMCLPVCGSKTLQGLSGSRRGKQEETFKYLWSRKGLMDWSDELTTISSGQDCQNKCQKRRATDQWQLTSEKVKCLVVTALWLWVRIMENTEPEIRALTRVWCLANLQTAETHYLPHRRLHGIWQLHTPFLAAFLFDYRMLSSCPLPEKVLL